MLKRRRLFSGMAAVSISILASSLAGAAGKPTALPGKWGCLGKAVLGDSTIGANISGSQLIQIVTDNKGNVSSGLLDWDSGGEVCTFAITGGAYSIGPAGVGTLSLTLAVPSANQDTDTDYACTDILNTSSSVTSVTENLKVIVAAGNKQLNFVAADDFLSGPSYSSDNGDYFSFAGQCLRQ